MGTQGLDTDSLRAILAKRTPGEWRMDYNRCGTWMMSFVVDSPHVFNHAFMSFDCRGEQIRANAAAIVAAVNACGPLLERVRTLEAEVERLRPMAESQEIENKVIEEMFG